MLEYASKEAEIRIETAYAAYNGAAYNGHQKVKPVESILDFPSEDRIVLRPIPGPIFELCGKGCYDNRNKAEEAADNETGQEMLRAIALDRPTEILYKLFHFSVVLVSNRIRYSIYFTIVVKSF